MTTAWFFGHLQKIEGLLRRTICCHKLHGVVLFAQGSLKNCDLGFMYVSKWQTWPLFSKVFREVSCPRFTLLWALYLRISLDVAAGVRIMEMPVFTPNIPLDSIFMAHWKPTTKKTTLHTSIFFVTGWWSNPSLEQIKQTSHSQPSMKNVDSFMPNLLVGHI